MKKFEAMIEKRMKPNLTPAAARKALQAERDREALAAGRLNEVATVALCKELGKTVTAGNLAAYTPLELELRTRLKENTKCT